MKEKESILTKSYIVCILAGMCCLLWGSAFPCIKIGYKIQNIASSETARQIFYAGMRFTLAGILVLLFELVGKKGKIKTIVPKVSSGFYQRAFLICLFQTVGQYFFFYVGLAHMDGSKAAIINGSNSFIAILIASLVFRMEQLNWRKLIGCILGFSGVVIVNINGGLGGGFQLLGEGFILLSAITHGVSGALIKKASNHYSPVLLSGWQFLMGGIVLMLTGFLMGGRVGINSISGAGLLLYLAFISAGAYTLWGVLMKYNDVSRVAIFGFMNPVFGVLLSFLILKESASGMGIRCLISLILIGTGIYIVNKQPKRAVG
jgi:drug/metabolite transporter (DMT)-like permease